MPRNSSGSMAPINGPYISGTTISTVAVNARFADLETEIGDSLSRSGKGGMIAVLRGADGTVAAPAYSFTSEVGTGIYKAAAGDVRLSISGADAIQFISSGITFYQSDAPNVSTVKPNSRLRLFGNRNAADPGIDVEIASSVTRTAGVLLEVRNANISGVDIDYQGLLRLLAPAAAIQPAGIWTAIVPNTNWTAGGGLGYFKDAIGIVRLRGFLTVGAGAANPIFTLPTGFRPSQNRYFAIANPNPAAGAVTAFVQSDGQVWMNTAITTGALLYFDSVAFLAEA